MHVLESIRVKCQTAWAVLVFASSLLFYTPLILAPLLWGKWGGGFHSCWMLKAWACTFSFLTGIKYCIAGQKNISDTQSYIYVSNHTSFIDIVGLSRMLRGHYKPLAKKELMLIPIFGWIVRAVCVVIDRENTNSRKRSIQELQRTLMRGISIVIFPEGTQNRSSQRLLPFRDGAFRIAVATQHPIMPMAVVGAHNIMPPTGFQFQPGRVHIKVGKPIITTAMTGADVPSLRKHTYDVIEQMLDMPPH